MDLLDLIAIAVSIVALSISIIFSWRNLSFTERNTLHADLNVVIQMQKYLNDTRETFNNSQKQYSDLLNVLADLEDVLKLISRGFIVDSVQRMLEEDHLSPILTLIEEASNAESRQQFISYLNARGFGYCASFWETR